jgi:hypothetical protein
MAASSSLQKRKSCDEVATPDCPCTFEAILVLENYWATDAVTLPASEAATIHGLFKSVKELIPVARRPGILGQKFAAPKFLLQETSVKTSNLRSSRYIVLSWKSDMSYHFWYERNVLNGNTDTLKVEIHLRTFSTAARESGEELETVKSCYKNSYVPFVPDSIKGQEHEYVVAPIDDEEVGMDEEDIAALVNWHSTEDWFPDKVKDAKKVRTSAAAEASNEANEEVNGEVKVEQGNDLDDGDDSSELSGLTNWSGFNTA